MGGGGERGEENEHSQVRAFNDTWKWGTESEKTFHHLMNVGDRVSDVIKGLRGAIGENNMMAYVTMMSIRLIELHRILKLNGSLYLHCDPTASHYLKIILDAIFLPENFKNEIIWSYRTGGSSKKTYAKKHDCILFYTKSKNYTFNTQKEKAYTKSKDRRPGVINYGQGKAEFFQDEIGVYNYVNMRDVWEIPYINSQSKERLGYPTQKPLELLMRIIQASSNKNDVVFDPFCGCGTTVHAAQKLNRNWIGIDITHLAIGLIEYRMKHAFNLTPKIIGVPSTFSDAKELSRRDKFQFEAWAVTRINGIKPNEKQTADRGIDGRGYIYLGKNSKGDPNYAKVIVSVKGGDNLTPSMIHELKGVVEREKAVFGIFMCIKKPTQGMIKEASIGGLVTTPAGQEYPKIQIYTIQDYFMGKQPNLPSRDAYLEVVQEQVHREKGKQLKFD